MMKHGRDVLRARKRDELSPRLQTRVPRSRFRVGVNFDAMRSGVRGPEKLGDGYSACLPRKERTAAAADCGSSCMKQCPPGSCCSSTSGFALRASRSAQGKKE